MPASCRLVRLRSCFGGRCARDRTARTIVCVPCSSFPRQAADVARAGARHSSDSSSRPEKRLSRCSSSSAADIERGDQRVEDGRGARRSGRRPWAVAGVDQFDRLHQPRPWASNCAASCERSSSTVAVTVLEALPIWSATRLLACAGARGDVVHDGRRIRTRGRPARFRAAAIFSCAPDITSCSRILASRRRSNSATVSVRSMPCVSIISETAARGRLLRLLDGRIGRVLQRLQRARDLAGGVDAGFVDAAASSPELSSIVRVKSKPLASISLTACLRGTADLRREVLALVGQAASSPLMIWSRMRVISAARAVTAAVISSALPVKVRADFGADAEQRAFHVLGILLQRGGDVG